MKTENATIKSTFLGIQDHGILTFQIELSGDSWGQCMGGYALDGHDDSLAYRPGAGIHLSAMRQIMETVGVRSWEELPGTLVRVQGSHTEVTAIGHIVKDKWFNLREFIDDYAQREAE